MTLPSAAPNFVDLCRFASLLTGTGQGTPTFTNGSASITLANSFVANQPIFFTTSGSLPTNFAINTIYYVIATGLSGAAFQVSATVGGSAITAGSAGSGTHTSNSGIQVGAAITGYRTPANAGVVDGIVYSYGIFDSGNPSEAGLCVFNSSGTMMARMPTSASPSGSAPVSMTASAQIAITAITATIAANNIHVSYFTATGANTFTTPAGSTTSTVYEFEAHGAGGGAGGTNQPGSASGGGGEGGIAKGTFSGLPPNTSVTVTIGAKGVGATGISGGNGTAGGNTTIVATNVSVTCNGGGGSSQENVANTGGPGAGGGAASVSGSNVVSSLTYSGATGMRGNGTAILAGAGGGPGGGPGGSTAISGAGIAATCPGSGGGGAVGVGGDGASGADGLALIRYVL